MDEIKEAHRSLEAQYNMILRKRKQTKINSQVTSEATETNQNKCKVIIRIIRKLNIFKTCQYLFMYVCELHIYSKFSTQLNYSFIYSWAILR